MPLRPVNAIFYHPKLKCIVVYQKGKLWQLSRMKLDMESWRRKTEFKGEKTELYLNGQQLITDEKLAKILPTQNFPETLKNATFHKFETWWLTNGFNWLLKPAESNSTNLQETKTDQSNNSILDSKKITEINIEELNNVSSSTDNTNSKNDTELVDWENW